MRAVLAFVLWVLSKSVVPSAHFSLTVIPANQPVYIGQEVIFTCQVKGFKPPRDYAVLFKRNDRGISEKCQAYQKQLYEVVCEPDDWRKATTYKLYVKSVSWDDRGDWFCIYAANSTQQRLDVYAPAKLEKMRVVGLSFPASGSVEKPVGTGAGGPSGSGSIVGTEVSMTSALHTGAIGDAPATHIGLGTRTNPYDLRRGLGLQLTCETTCGYPDASISWLVSNETTSRPGNTTISPNQISSRECNRSAATHAMTSTRSTLMVQCVQLGLVGLNQVECAVSGPQYSDPRPTRHVYVLCPDEYELNQQRQAVGLSADARLRRRGERPMLLTNGEVVGIAVGSAMAFILLFAGCLIIRGNRKESPLPFNGHFLGQRV